MTQIQTPTKLTPDEAIAKGYIVDSHCSPWVAYKGPRFDPTEWFYVFTADEAQLVTTLRVLLNDFTEHQNLLAAATALIRRDLAGVGVKL